MNPNQKPRSEWTLEDLEHAFGSVTMPDGTVWIRCVSRERIAEAGLLALEKGGRLNEIPVVAEVD
jgi:hypothetical protein